MPDPDLPSQSPPARRAFPWGTLLLMAGTTIVVGLVALDPGGLVTRRAKNGARILGSDLGSVRGLQLQEGRLRVQTGQAQVDEERSRLPPR